MDTTEKTNNSPIQIADTEQPDMVKRIGNTTFDIYVHFSQTSKETFTDKVLRLIQNDISRKDAG